MELSKYMDDGADWQSQGVLAYLRNYSDTIKDSGCYGEDKKFNIVQEIGVTRYDNCREQGYIFFVKSWDGNQRNFIVYQHRNSDELCVVVNDRYTFNDPLSPEMWDCMKDKWDYKERFPYGQILECGEWVMNAMVKFIDECVEKKEYNKKENEI